MGVNIVESDKYSRGNCDSKPGFHAPYFVANRLLIIVRGHVVQSPLVETQPRGRDPSRLISYEWFCWGVC